MLSEEEFQELARLARLDPDDPGLHGMRTEFNKILDYVNHIGEVETSEVAEGLSADDTRNVTRADVPQSPLELRRIGQFAARWEAGHFVVPGVIESEG